MGGSSDSLLINRNDFVVGDRQRVSVKTLRLVDRLNKLTSQTECLFVALFLCAGETGKE
jgi:hypothetical protein